LKPIVGVLGGVAAVSHITVFLKGLAETGVTN
jgi:hypothetical protein